MIGKGEIKNGQKQQNKEKMRYITNSKKDKIKYKTTNNANDITNIQQQQQNP